MRSYQAFVFACCGFLALCFGAAQAQTRIALVTFGPGEEYWSRFGHNGILVERPDRDALIYNFGYFDFEQPNFLGRFLRGRMLYSLMAIEAGHDLAYYAQAGRSVDLQWLRLSESSAAALARQLEDNAKAENAAYRYDYFTANCSTRVRDALDFALGGELRRQTEGRSHGLSYRSEALRLASTLPWLAVGIDLGLGVSADRAISVWQEGFVPAHLQEALRELRAVDGQAIVEREQHLAKQTVAAAPIAPPRWTAWFLGTGIGAALAIAVLLRTQRRLAASVLALWWLLCGAIGCALLALWLATDHEIAWANRNALLFNPLALLALPACVGLWRGAPIAPTYHRLAIVLAASGFIVLFLMLVPKHGQDSLNWLCLSLPIHLAIALRLPRQAPGLPLLR